MSKKKLYMTARELERKLPAWKRASTDYPEELINKHHFREKFKGLKRSQLALVASAEIEVLSDLARETLKRRIAAGARRAEDNPLPSPANMANNLSVREPPHKKQLDIHPAARLFTTQRNADPELVAAQNAFAAKMKLGSHKYSRKLIASSVKVASASVPKALVRAKTHHLKVQRLIKEKRT